MMSTQEGKSGISMADRGLQAAPPTLPKFERLLETHKPRSFAFYTQKKMLRRVGFPMFRPE
jgi:hypothetical protein